MMRAMIQRRPRAVVCACLVALLGGSGCGSDESGSARGGAASSGGAGGSGGSSSGGNDVIPRPVVERVIEEAGRFDNARGETIRARWFVPDVEEPLPAVVVLHGSGGLFRQLEPGETTDNAPCSSEMERQFQEWAELLPSEGYVTLMPSSFASRGFCDYNEDAPPDFDEEARLVARVFDLYGGIEALCADARVRCDRIGLLGFSNGGSATVLGLHEQLGAVIELGGLPPPAAEPRLGVAYYPGCGLQGFVSLSEDPARLSDHYYPRAPLWVQHASLDGLLDNCELRDRQSRAVATERSVESALDLHVYDGADHGFDSTPDNAVEEAARSDARARTLDLLRTALFGGVGPPP